MNKRDLIDLHRFPNPALDRARHFEDDESEKSKYPFGHARQILEDREGGDDE